MPDVVSTVSAPAIIDMSVMRRMDEMAYLLEFIERSDRYR